MSCPLATGHGHSMYTQAGLFCVYEALHHTLEELGCRDLGVTAKLQVGWVVGRTRVTLISVILMCVTQ
jgi:hypothetical protein